MVTANKDTVKQPDIKAAGRSASYPWISLETAVERLTEFWKAETTHEVAVKAAYKDWGYAEKSSGARLTVAAMLNYGLLADKGANEQRTVKITPLGIDIVMPPHPAARDAALKTAAIKPRIFREVLNSIDPENPPSDQAIAHTLVTQKGFNPTAVETFLKNLKQTIKYAKLKKSDIMSVTSEAPAEPVDDTHGLQGKVVNLTPSTGGMSAVGQSGAAQRVTFKQDVYNFADGGQVVLQWPEGMSAEDLEEFEEWIELQKKKIRRATIKASEPQQ